MNQPITTSAKLQMDTMRVALERAGRTAVEAQQATARAMRDLQIERERVRQLMAALDQAATRVEEAELENRRLRSLMGGMHVQKDSMSRELRALIEDVRAVTAPEPHVIIGDRIVAA